MSHTNAIAVCQQQNLERRRCREIIVMIELDGILVVNADVGTSSWFRPGDRVHVLILMVSCPVPYIHYFINTCTTRTVQ